MSEKISMHIQVSMNIPDTDTVLEKVMECINQAAKDKLQWKKHKIHDSYETRCGVHEEDIISVFHELQEKYPELNLYASYSHSIREDDSSAQWWETVKIKTERYADGTVKLSTDSSINWF